MKENKELKPCPFCGSMDIKRVLDEDPEWTYAHLECQMCGAKGPEVISPNGDYILTALWNRRPFENHLIKVTRANEG